MQKGELRVRIDLLNDQVNRPQFEASEAVLVILTADLVHQIVVTFQANTVKALLAQKDREQVKQTETTFKQGTGRARAIMTSSAFVARRAVVFSRRTAENFAQKSTRCTPRRNGRHFLAVGVKTVWLWSIRSMLSHQKPKHWQPSSRNHEPWVGYGDC
jgi:hypothetical protein